jgi:hypothetical protein
MYSLDPNAYGVLVGISAKIVVAFNNRFISLSNELSISRSTETLSDIIKLVGVSILAMELEKRHIIKVVVKQINASFHLLELDDVQENYFVRLIENQLLKKDVGS